jgi:O-antigen/teichoic acid export membrane protein
MKDKLKALRLNSEFMRYFNNTSWLFFDRIFKVFVGFLVIMYLTQYLGPKNFGVLSYSQSFVSIFMAFSSLGLSSIIVRELIKYPEKIDLLLGTTFYLTLFTSLFSIVAIGLLNSFYFEDSVSNTLVFIISISIIFQNLNIVIDSYFQYKVLSKYIVYATSIGFLISSALKILLIYNKAELIYFAYALLFDSVVLSLGFIYIYKKQNLNIFSWKFDFRMAKYFLKIAWPLVWVAVSVFIYTRIDQVMIKHMIGDEAVGNYAAAIKVSELFYFIPGIIVSSLFPKLVELKKENEAQYLNLLEKMYRLVIWISIPIAMGIFIFSDMIVNMLYGVDYKEAGRILSILSWGIIFIAVGTVFVKILYVEQYEKKYLYKSMLGVLVNTLLNYFLIKVYGVRGAAFSTLITLFIINYIYDLSDKDLRKFYFLKIKSLSPYPLSKKL